MCGHDMSGGKGCACKGTRMEGFMQPCLLLMLSEKPAHGYELMENMNRLGLWEGLPDAGAIYRNLRRMEEEGLVKSNWATEGTGPARRLYEITPEGTDLLRDWAVAIQKHKAALETFLDRYKSLFD